MKLVEVFSNIYEFCDVALAVMVAISVWVRTHCKMKKKVNKLDDRLYEVDEYISKRFSELSQLFNSYQMSENIKEQTSLETTREIKKLSKQVSDLQDKEENIEQSKEKGKKKKSK